MLLLESKAGRHPNFSTSARQADLAVHGGPLGLGRTTGTFRRWRLHGFRRLALVCQGDGTGLPSDMQTPGSTFQRSAILQSPGEELRFWVVAKIRRTGPLPQTEGSQARAGDDLNAAARAGTGEN